MPELTFQPEQLLELPFVSDENVSPAQMLAPQRRLGLQTAQRPQRTQEQRRESGVASVPFMIGDTGAGSCISYGSFLIEVDLGHPTLACGRLNIAEANTPLPIDRIYYSYRHFANATPTRVFQYSKDFDVDRHTIAGERTFCRRDDGRSRFACHWRTAQFAGRTYVNPFDQRLLAYAPDFDPLLALVQISASSWAMSR